MTDNLVALLHRTSQRANMTFTKCAGEIGTPSQAHVLAALARLGTASQAELVKATGIDRSTMADVVRRLKNAGLVARKRTRADARAYEVSLTDAGLRAAEKLARASVAAEDAMLGELPVKLRTSLLTALARLATRPAASLEAAE